MHRTRIGVALLLLLLLLLLLVDRSGWQLKSIISMITSE
jgi:hypothetical protein